MELKLLMIQNGKEREIDLNGANMYSMGRVGTDILIDDPNCSKSHAVLFESVDGKLGLRDMGSTNGTGVNGKRISEAYLGSGDKIHIGNTIFVVVQFRISPSSTMTRRAISIAPPPLKTDAPKEKTSADEVVMSGWPNNFRSLPKEKLEGFVDHVEEDVRNNSVRLKEIVGKRKGSK